MTRMGYVDSLFRRWRAVNSTLAEGLDRGAPPKQDAARSRLSLGPSMDYVNPVARSRKRSPGRRTRRTSAVPRGAVAADVVEVSSAPEGATDTVAPGERGGVAAADGMVVRRSPEELRVDMLRRQHEKLLRDIAKKKAALRAMDELVRDVTERLLQGLGPIKGQFDEAVGVVHRLFVELLGAGSHLSRREQARVRSAYYELLDALDIQIVSSTDDDELVEETGRGQEEHDWSRRTSNEATTGDAGFSASKPAENHASTLRTLFRRLAVALHPDKVQCESEKAERTTWMKDVTRAYEAGDVARLVELERTLLAREPLADEPRALRVRIQELDSANAELRRQLRQLTEEHKQARASMPIPVDLRAKKRLREQVETQLQVLITTAQQELDDLQSLQRFVQRFVDGKMGLREFLAGPMARPEPSVVSVDVLIDEFMRDFGGFTPAARRRSSSRPARG